MPELPEVEVIRLGLAPIVTGREVKSCYLSGQSLRHPVPAEDIKTWVLGQKISDTGRRAKYLLLNLNNGASLIFHLGMSGRLTINPAGQASGKHDHVRLLLDNGFELRLNDARRFGSLRILKPGDDRNSFFKKIGPEPFSKAFSPKYLLSRAVGRARPVKNFLMDGEVVAGIGNIYASEILFAAGINPSSPAGSLDNKDWAKIIKASKAVLKKAIACGGTTIMDFVNSSNEAGYFQNELLVYKREGECCSRCGTTIQQTKMAGRATYYCPGCQRQL